MISLYFGTLSIYTSNLNRLELNGVRKVYLKVCSTFAKSTHLPDELPRVLDKQTSFLSCTQTLVNVAVTALYSMFYKVQKLLNKIVPDAFSTILCNH